MAPNPVGGGGATPTAAAGTADQSNPNESELPVTFNVQRRQAAQQNRIMNLRRAARAMSNRVRRAAAGGPASGRATNNLNTNPAPAAARPRGRSRAGRP